MRKVRVKKEIPFFTVGQIIELDEQGQIWFRARGQASCYNRCAVEEMLSDKWLEEVVEEKNLAFKLYEQHWSSSGEYDSIPEKHKEQWNRIAKVAMLHAVEIVKKTTGSFSGDRIERIIEALKKEAELNKTKEG